MSLLNEVTDSIETHKYSSGPNPSPNYHGEFGLWLMIGRKSEEFPPRGGTRVNITRTERSAR